ncbi:MAG: DUF167 domain-containing protein [Brevinema sp.]
MFMLTLTVVPRSSINKFVKEDAGIKLKITSPPIDGEANKKIIVFLAKNFLVPKSSIQLITGKKSKKKIFLFHSLHAEEGAQKLSLLLQDS